MLYFTNGRHDCQKAKVEKCKLIRRDTHGGGSFQRGSGRKEGRKEFDGSAYLLISLNPDRNPGNACKIGLTTE